jgi:hypothetical protein
VNAALLLIICSTQVVPYWIARPRIMASSITVRIVVHLWAGSIAVGAAIYPLSNPLKRAAFVASLAVVVQYWIFMAMERQFEKHAGREPRLTPFMQPVDITWRDRVVSVAWVFVSITSMLAVFQASADAGAS